jgi:DNA-binding NarL/FixJ family response regulator
MARNQLTPRETEVVRLLSLGCSMHDAASILDLSANTVDNHRTRAMKKLGVNKASLLTRVAIKMKVTTINDKLTPEEMKLSGRMDDGWNVSDE